ncbi:MAG: S24/S26 family peptidase [Prevotella sp.]|jgi:hypothetical protein|nr:S24/S26 family peptidase [Prevotella sp.]MCI1415495.1 S24/S26 family peptidase [Prevotella sp.]MCI1816610.1 S24/S26 family peptidase [Prevotella sp.]MCI2180670.1 S24/S26 family peptidase [Prevotella sp.]
MRKEVPNALLIPEIAKMLEEGHTVTLGLKGFSMRPFLEDGRDTVLLTRPDHVHKGDTVLAEITPGQYVLHRIIRIKRQEVVLRGDGNIGTERCTLHDIKGFAQGFYRKGRNRPDRTNGLKWKLYSNIWCTLFPVRRYLLAVYRRLWIPLFGPL